MFPKVNKCFVIKKNKFTFNKERKNGIYFQINSNAKIKQFMYINR